MDRLSPPDAVRLCASLAQSEIARVRRDPVAAALLAQAARHADGLGPGPLVAAAATLARTLDPAADEPSQRAGRKVVQALCRAAVQQAESYLLPGGAP